MGLVLLGLFTSKKWIYISGDNMLVLNRNEAKEVNLESIQTKILKLGIITFSVLIISYLIRISFFRLSGLFIPIFIISGLILLFDVIILLIIEINRYLLNISSNWIDYTMFYFLLFLVVNLTGAYHYIYLYYVSHFIIYRILYYLVYVAVPVIILNNYAQTSKTNNSMNIFRFLLTIAVFSLLLFVIFVLNGF